MLQFAFISHLTAINGALSHPLFHSHMQFNFIHDNCGNGLTRLVMSLNAKVIILGNFNQF